MYDVIKIIVFSRLILFLFLVLATLALEEYSRTSVEIPDDSMSIRWLWRLPAGSGRARRPCCCNPGAAGRDGPG
eukprot:COSAG01_NODE_11762_length_1863_cov_36.839002_1_plen_74_part_00